MDIPGADKNYERVQMFLSNEGYRIFPISGATKQGVRALLDKVYNILEVYVEDEEVVEDIEEILYNRR